MKCAFPFLLPPHKGPSTRRLFSADTRDVLLITHAGGRAYGSGRVLRQGGGARAALPHSSLGCVVPPSARFPTSYVAESVWVEDDELRFAVCTFARLWCWSPGGPSFDPPAAVHPGLAGGLAWDPHSGVSPTCLISPGSCCCRIWEPRCSVSLDPGAVDFEPLSSNDGHSPGRGIPRL